MVQDRSGNAYAGAFTALLGFVYALAAVIRYFTAHMAPQGWTTTTVLLLIVGLYVMVGLFKRMTALAGRWFEGFRQALKQSYIKALIPRLLGIIALTLLGYAALIGVTYLLMVFSAQPLYVFTEWVPENIVEWSSISKVFWSLTASAGRLVRIGTRELRVVQFWGGIMRWGMISLLLGFALRARKQA